MKQLKAVNEGLPPISAIGNCGVDGVFGRPSVVLERKFSFIVSCGFHAFACTVKRCHPSVIRLF
jgi:hypothetical protein